MGGLVSKVTDAIGLTDSKAGRRAAASTQEASGQQVDALNKVLDLFNQRNQLFDPYRIGALEDLEAQRAGGVQDITGATSQQLLSRAQRSPLYSALLGGREAGERSILRNAAATGGLRGGGSQAELSEFNTNLENQALLGALGFEQQQEANRIGLAERNLGRQLTQRTGINQALLGLPDYTGGIASTLSNIGATQAQGTTAAAQARATGDAQNRNNLLGTITGIGGLLFSDRRLKSNIEKVNTENGYNIYKWKWNDKAKPLGLEGHGRGVLADEVKEVNPDAIKWHNGYMTVDYNMIGVKHG